MGAIKVKVITPPAPGVPKSSHYEFIDNSPEGIRKAVRGDYVEYHMGGNAEWVAFYNPAAENEFKRPTHRFWDTEMHGRIVIAGWDGNVRELAYQVERYIRDSYEGIFG